MVVVVVGGHVVVDGVVGIGAGTCHPWHPRKELGKAFGETLVSMGSGCTLTQGTLYRTADAYFRLPKNSQLPAMCYQFTLSLVYKGDEL